MCQYRLIFRNGVESQIMIFRLSNYFWKIKENQHTRFKKGRENFWFFSTIALAQTLDPSLTAIEIQFSSFQLYRWSQALCPLWNYFRPVFFSPGILWPLRHYVCTTSQRNLAITENHPSNSHFAWLDPEKKEVLIASRSLVEQIQWIDNPTEFCGQLTR